MKYTLAVCLFLTDLVYAQTSSVTFDQFFDNGAESLNAVACSSGPNGLVTDGFTIFDSLPNFPFIGGAPTVSGFNSASCGTCWALTFQGFTINVIAIDHSTGGFRISLEAMNALTSNQAESLGRAAVTATEVAKSLCGL